MSSESCNTETCSPGLRTETGELPPCSGSFKSILKVESFLTLFQHTADKELSPAQIAAATLSDSGRSEHFH